ncbi:polyamine transporter [Scenedesmus sp. PABB004]|nr:polyamine transporter [Scenedesmus sp. PABB004]
MKAHGTEYVRLGSADVESPFAAAGGSGAADSGAGSGAHHQARKKPLTLLPLIALIFFEVSGGPFGTEDAVAAGGPLLVLAGFVIFPLLWSVPEALITAELATAFPENSGYVAWVTAAFGPFWGFQEGFWSWLSGVTDNSIYPVMFADNLRIFVPALNGGWPRMAFLVGVSVGLTYLNYRGLSVVGHTALTTTAFIITPFLLLCALAAPQATPANWLQVDWGAVRWGTFLNIMFWNLNYWDSISCLAGEVDDPSRTFPRALLWAVLLVVLSYLLPTAAALGVSVDTSDWTLGYYGRVAQKVGGNWLAWWVVLAAAASQVGQFQAEMSSDSYQLQGMAERGFLPRALARRSRHGTPTAGILLSSVGVVALASFSFVDIVELLNAVYCLAELLEFAAFVWLRVRAPALPRPYKVPLPTWGVVAMLAPATLLLLAILVIPIYERNATTMAATGGAMLAGFVLYPLLGLARERGWCGFSDLAFDYAHALSPEPGGGGGHGRSYTIHATGAIDGHAGDDAADGGGPDGGDGGSDRSGGCGGGTYYAAPYVRDVVHDGATGVRTTSSMDLGSRGGSASAGSPGGRSPRSPLLAAARGGRSRSRSGSAGAPAAPALGGGLAPSAAAISAAVAAAAAPAAARSRLRDVASFRVRLSGEWSADGAADADEGGAPASSGGGGTLIDIS